jgi:tRNA-2-methylthio-N6-dimethylallyladenosine synthase
LYVPRKKSSRKEDGRDAEMKKTFFIETFGCQMNKGDSELMAHSMRQSGFQAAGDAKNADIIIFNTCSVRQHAETRALSRIRSAKSGAKEKNGIVVVAGCMAQRLGENLLGKKAADIVIGPYQSPSIGEIINKYFIDTGCRSFLSLEPSDFKGRLDKALAKSKDLTPWHKWVTITHGCENYCAYCIVPYVRGRLISFPSDSIIKYVELCAQNGVREITLLGQNVNQYGMDSGDVPFYKLLEKAALVKDIYRINFLTSHPKDFSFDIINVIRDHEKISRAIHLPLQSGSDKILAAMNRQYTSLDYYKIVEHIDLKLESYSISTDLIVGFPGETREDFELTLKAVKDINFDEAFMYAYSPREGTPAFKLPETLSKQEKSERLQELIRRQRSISKDKLKSRVNHIEEIIVEGLSKKSENEVMGKTFMNHPVVLPGGPDDAGKKIRIMIKGIKGQTLYGERIE